MARSTAYWAANFYPNPDAFPRPGAPLRDLPPLAAQRFRLLRKALLEIAGVSEKIRFILPNWKWTWEYSLPARKLCWLHVMETGLAGTFAISDDDERQLERAKLAGVIVLSVREGHRTGPVRWCSVDFTDRKSIEGFLGFMRKKAAWITVAPQDRRVARRTSAG